MSEPNLFYFDLVWLQYGMSDKGKQMRMTMMFRMLCEYQTNAVVGFGGKNGFSCPLEGSEK